MTLEKFTNLVVEIVPDLGTRFVFPFVLDDHKESYIPFTLNSTNVVFRTDRQKERNSFVVDIDRTKVDEAFKENMPEYRGILFITAADYLITIELRTTKKLDDQVTDIIFKLGDLEQEVLIQKVIDKRILALEADYQQELEKVDALASQKVLAKIGELIVETPKIKNIKEEAIFNFGRDAVVLYVDRSVTYGPYVSFVYEIENEGDSGLSVSHIRLLQTNEEQGASLELPSETSLPPRLMADQKYTGVISVTADVLSEDEYLTLEAITNKGKIETKW